jgi:hypothetical protein
MDKLASLSWQNRISRHGQDLIPGNQLELLQLAAAGDQINTVFPKLHLTVLPAV